MHLSVQENRKNKLQNERKIKKDFVIREMVSSRFSGVKSLIGFEPFDH